MLSSRHGGVMRVNTREHSVKLSLVHGRPHGQIAEAVERGMDEKQGASKAPAELCKLPFGRGALHYPRASHPRGVLPNVQVTFEHLTLAQGPPIHPFRALANGHRELAVL